MWSPNWVHSACRPLLAYCTCSGWLWGWRIWWNEDWQGKQKYLKKTYRSATLSTTNPTWPDPCSNPGRHGGKPATNRLNYGHNQQRCIILKQVEGLRREGAEPRALWGPLLSSGSPQLIVNVIIFLFMFKSLFLYLKLFFFFYFIVTAEILFWNSEEAVWRNDCCICLYPILEGKQSQSVRAYNSHLLISHQYGYVSFA
jgi:hypothetical protein